MKKILPYIMLHSIIFVYSIECVFSKLAAAEPFLSFKWILYYGIVLFLLAIYAVLWQQILKKIPLNTAYSNKAVTMIWGMFWGIIIFKETINIANIIGALLIIAGIILMVTGDKNSINKEEDTRDE